MTEPVVDAEREAWRKKVQAISRLLDVFHQGLVALEQEDGIPVRTVLSVLGPRGDTAMMVPPGRTMFISAVDTLIVATRVMQSMVKPADGGNVH